MENPAEDPRSPKQIAYRDARLTKQYDGIWQSVGKCVFCDLRDKYILYEENRVVLTVSLFAYIDGHMMIIPRRHVRSPKDLTELEWATMRKFTYLAKKLIREQTGIKAMQLIFKDGAQAQSTVSEHLHFHCVPFDAPDLTVWNYRQLKYTPLENAIRYRRARKELIESKLKFEQKYESPHALPLVCDLIWLSEGHILFQERQAKDKFVPDVISLPGGVVNDFTKPFEQELAREILEETGATIQPADCRLVDSRISRMHKRKTSPHLRVTYLKQRTFIWNTYLYQDPGPQPSLQPGDDCEALVWVRVDDIAGHPRISPEIKATIAKLRAEGRLP